MQISNLEVFLLVAQLKSLSKASKLLHLSQPAVSNKIHLLEEELNTSLFERSPYGVSLTEEGQTVFQYAQEILHTYHQLVETIHPTKQPNKEKLMIGTESMIGSYFLPCKIWSFMDKYPMVEMKIITYDRANLFKELEEHSIDVALVEGAIPSESPFHSQIISTEPVYLAVPNQKKWQNIDVLPLHELYEIEMILPDENTGFRQTVEKALIQQGIQMNKLHIIAETNNVGTMKSLVESGKGVSFMCDTLKNMSHSLEHIKLLKVESLNIKIDYYLVYSSENTNPVLKPFIEELFL
ncbi:LysR substrate-binding domain-containing protein [Tepidibacillus infernus]|uniref:HTH lysR-type domain-containing protein n=1 Tax=Tepidibacillus decaturensis TaxID=1413211 RepID=A0A135L4R4_9BACI|nr:LysR family transcriptional regulator [Tepidibacillus decaturensis]KXG43920.1 hypothetical protein U473_07800 [Tepidibacillus decaturensis]